MKHPDEPIEVTIERYVVGYLVFWHIAFIDKEKMNRCNDEKVIELGRKKLEEYIISDNARYYHNKKLKEWVDGTKIGPIFQPPYSPNLNLIGRLWKFLRKKVINTGFYRVKE